MKFVKLIKIHDSNMSIKQAVCICFFYTLIFLDLHKLVTLIFCLTKDLLRRSIYKIGEFHKPFAIFAYVLYQINNSRLQLQFAYL